MAEYCNRTDLCFSVDVPRSSADQGGLNPLLPAATFSDRHTHACIQTTCCHKAYS